MSCTGWRDAMKRHHIIIAAIAIVIAIALASNHYLW
jgi:hypothetical protein